MGRALDTSGQARNGFAKFPEGEKKHRNSPTLHIELCIDCEVLVEKSGSILEWQDKRRKLTCPDRELTDRHRRARN